MTDSAVELRLAALGARVERLERAFVALAASVAPASRSGRDPDCRALFRLALELSRAMSDELLAEKTRLAREARGGGGG